MILVTGDGILAKELIKHSTKDLSIVSLSKQEMDITNEYQVSNIIKKYMMMPAFPKYLIHTAALTKPMSVNDKNPITSINTNIIGTANIAKICYKYDIKFIYISTDFVYKEKQELVNEDSGLKPKNKYGWSKLGGECVSQIIPNSLILRCALCDIPFRHKMAFSNIYRTPIIHKEAAKIILKLKDEEGVINIGGEKKSIYEFVKNYQEIKPYHYPKDEKNTNSQVMSIKLNTQKMKKCIV